jgi:hypothetical protein
MYNQGESQETSIIVTKELKSAFQSIQYVLYHKEEQIKQLEEENLILKRKIKEMESQTQNSEYLYQENLKIPQSEAELIYAKENKYKNTSSQQNQNSTSYGRKFQNDREDFLSLPGSPYNNQKNTQNENFRINYVPVYTNENNNYMYSPSQNLDILKSPVRTQTSEESNFSRNEVKYFLNEVRDKIPSKDFKEFIKLIKILTEKNNQGSVNRKEIFDKVKNLFGLQFKDMYNKFELLLSLKNK